MDFKEITLLTLSSLKERRTRNILTILMITMGCGLLVSLSSLTQGLISFVEQNFKRILPNQLIISNSEKIQQSNLENIQNKLQVLFDRNLTMVEKRIPFDNNTIRFLENISGVESVDPAFQGMTVLKSGNNSEISNVIATSINSLKNIIPDIGNNHALQESSKKENFIVMPQKLSKTLFVSSEDKNSSSSITIQGINQDSIMLSHPTEPNNNEGDNFDVIATVNSTGNPIIDNSVFIETNKGREILNKSDDYDLVFLTYNDIGKVDGIVKSIQNHFSNQVTILNSLEIIKTLTKLIVGVSTFISSIAVFSLIVAAIGIIITIYTSVVERTREIGIIKALGGTNRTILSMFLTESAILGIIGASIGILFGFLGSHVLLSSFLFFLSLPIKISPIFDMVEISKILIIVVGLSVFSGLYPAYKGSKISPVDALNK
ncbi:MAG: ABC transporter permease [Candidatus Nitrosocosmicus sp.]